MLATSSRTASGGVSMSHFLSRRPDTLTGTERQKVAVSSIRLRTRRMARQRTWRTDAPEGSRDRLVRGLISTARPGSYQEDALIPRHSSILLQAGRGCCQDLQNYASDAPTHCSKED